MKRLGLINLVPLHSHEVKDCKKGNVLHFFFNYLHLKHVFVKTKEVKHIKILQLT